MVSKDFAAFVNEQNQAAQASDIDPAAQIAEWLERIETLHLQVRGFLSPFIDNSGVRIDTRTIEMNEEALGSYTAPVLRIAIGHAVAELVPVGTLIIGSYGRVDLKGPRDLRKLVLVRKDTMRVEFRVLSQQEAELQRQEEANGPPTDLTWKFSLGPRLDFVDLNEDSFTTAIMEVTR